MTKNPLACGECHLIIPDEKKSGPYSRKKKKELVEELESRGLSKDGKVEDLIHRLIEYDFEQKDLSELVTELAKLNPTADTDCEKDEIISKLMKEKAKKHQPKCNRCPSAPVSADWNGYVIIMQPNRSEIAKRLQVELPGKYALKVNIN